ncbi:MAG: hypothetical protein Q7T55_13565 [Solirubrobacteraceae bacterium]|nr:hypothetical protein [Solirubrobacteraceae bacterium]
MQLHSAPLRIVRVLSLLLIAAFAFAAPQTASAKTFVANVSDASGDADKSTTDIVKARIAYNRKTGAVSVSVAMKSKIDATNDDAIVSVVFSDLKNGKCQKATMIVSAILSLPGGAVATTMKKGKRGTDHGGSSSVDGQRLNMRVKAKALSGRTPGCTYVVLFRNDEGRATLDETKGNDGFS